MTRVWDPATGSPWVLAVATAAALAGLVALVALGAAARAYARDMRDAWQRITHGSQLLQLPQAVVEYSDRGQGPPVLVVHGSGGGFDQGEFLADVALGGPAAGWRIVAPSRFGYLRSTLPDGATFSLQADVYAALLDHLQLPRVAVVAVSHGGPSALLLALRHPQRVSSLTLISAGVTADADAAQRGADRRGAALARVFQHDALYWALTHALRGPFLSLMGVPPDVAAGLDDAQRQLTAQLVDVMNPVSPRAAGAAFDHRAAMPDAGIAAIRAPTLIVHARDDGLQRFRQAEFAQAHLPDARLLAFDRGGHLVLAVQQAAVRQAVTAHVRAAATGTASPGMPACAGQPCAGPR